MGTNAVGRMRVALRKGAHSAVHGMWGEPWLDTPGAIDRVQALERLLLEDLGGHMGTRTRPDGNVVLLERSCRSVPCSKSLFPL